MNNGTWTVLAMLTLLLPGAILGAPNTQDDGGRALLALLPDDSSDWKECATLVPGATDEAPAELRLGEGVSGRFIIRRADHRLVADLFKPAGQTLELRLEPGEYLVHATRHEEQYLGASTLGSGNRVVLRPAQTGSLEHEPAVLRGVEAGGPTCKGDRPRPLGGLSVSRRHRLEFSVGTCDTGPPRAITSECSNLLATDVQDLLGALSYSYWVDENLAAVVSLKGLVVEARSTEGPSNQCESAIVLTSAMFGVRLYPLATAGTPVRPYVTASAGPYIGVESVWGPPDGTDGDWTETHGTFGGNVGGGLDIQMGRYFMAGVNAGYNFMGKFSEPLAGKRSYEGAEYSIGLSVLFGRGI